jgi:hypothetical protein
MKKRIFKEETQSDPLGKYAWPHERVIKGEVPDEINTELENKLIDAIQLHFDGIRYFSSEEASQLQNLLSKNLYSDIISEPKVDVVYRTMYVPKQWIQHTLGIKSISNKGMFDKNFKFHPLQGRASSSWTESYKFAEHWGIVFDSYVILHAKISDNKNSFLSGKNGLYKLKNPNVFLSQEEVVGLFTINVFKLSWRIISADDF